MWPRFDSWTRRHMWVEFVACSERFFSGYSGFPLSSKTNISKFQLTLKSPERDESIKYVNVNIKDLSRLHGQVFLGLMVTVCLKGNRG